MKAHRFQLLVLMAGLAASARAQDVELRIEARTLQEGEVAEVTLVCTNTGEPSPPKFQAPEGLELHLLNPLPSRSTKISMVNNRRSDTTTYTYGMRLIAKKAGSYTLGPIVITAGGTTYQTDPIPITVTRDDSAAQKDGDKLVFARISVQPYSLFVTQYVEATLTLAIRKFEIDGRPIELGNLLQLVDADGSDLSVFGTRFTSSEITLNDSTGKPHTYLLYRQTREIRAEQPGTLSIGPVFFKVNYPLTLRRSLFGGYDVAQSRRETARAPAIEVEVRSPPAEGRPFDFAGAIGQYKLSVTVKPTRVEEGQPMTLTMAIKGEPLEGVAGPDLSRNPELAARFDFAAEEWTGDREGEAKIFRRAIFPRRAGEQVIPPITWSYFDPGAEQYVTLSSQPITIVVDPSTDPEHVPSGSTEPASARDTLTVISGGLSPNYVDPEKLLASQSLTLSPAALAAALAAPPALCLVLAVVSWSGARRRDDAQFVRRRRARRIATMRIHQAQQGGGPRLDLMAHALTGYCSDRLGLPPGELTPDEARRALAERTGDADLASQVAQFLAGCDEARFAGGAGAIAPEHAVQTAFDLISRIEKRTK